MQVIKINTILSQYLMIDFMLCLRLLFMGFIMRVVVLTIDFMGRFRK